MKPKVYIAAQYRQKADIDQKKKELEGLGFTVTSTWTEEKDSPNVSLKEVEDRILLDYAERDVREIKAADLLVLFTVDPDEMTRRGGRHVEFGYAMGQGKQVAIVGPRENIFHHLPEVPRFASWPQFVEELSEGEFECPARA